MNHLPIQPIVEIAQKPTRIVRPDQASARIIAYVAERYDVPAEMLRAASQEAIYVAPRHVAMYLVWDLRKFSFPRIGRIFGGRHHTTVLYAVQKVESNRQDPRVAAFLEEAKVDLAELLRGPFLQAPKPGVLHVPEARVSVA